MRFLTRLAVLFYVTIILFLGVLMTAYALHWIDVQYVLKTFFAIFVDDKLRLIFGATGAVLLVINFIFYSLFTVNIHREKIIAFDNPAGRVTVSLIAMEDVIKKAILKVEDVREVKASIWAAKKGLLVRVKMSLATPVSIPEFSSRIQDLVRDKIQDMIGIDEPLNISVYINKISLSDQPSSPSEVEAEKTENDKEITNPFVHIPFRGYRA